MPGITNFNDYQVNFTTAPNQLPSNPTASFERESPSYSAASFKDVKIFIVLGAAVLAYVYFSASSK